MPTQAEVCCQVTQQGIQHLPACSHVCMVTFLQAVYGNWVNGKRRGVVGGVDYVYTGRVRSLNIESIKSQLHSGNIVLLTSLAYSLAGGACQLHLCLRTSCANRVQLCMMFCTLADRADTASLTDSRRGAQLQCV